MADDKPSATAETTEEPKGKVATKKPTTKKSEVADTIQEKLVKIQSELKAPKGQYNSFGKYKYRSCEDILEAVKPLLKEKDLLLVVSDGMVQMESRFYVKATAVILHGEETITVTGFAREAENKKGMDESQITGAASSYARKYALNGLFLIDDTKDADTNEHKNQVDKTPAKKAAAPKKTEAPAPAWKPTTEQVTVLRDLMKEKGLTEDQKVNTEKFITDKATYDKMISKLNLKK
ncbi:MAG: hypothetical protein DRP02_02255 [Candidatus Gerdarchaeota archaeon]|nr:MAG: hypothetical protein DRP02_02255 [Candidatus Gerdarchaeota archaeon]